MLRDDEGASPIVSLLPLFPAGFTGHAAVACLPNVPVLKAKVKPAKRPADGCNRAKNTQEG